MNVAARTELGERSLPAEMTTVPGKAFGLRRLWGNQENIQRGAGRPPGAGIHGLGLTAQELADMISQANAATLPLIVAQNPGTYMQTDPATGRLTVYAQPMGNLQNYYGGGGGYAVGAPGVLGTPTATLGGSVGVGTMLLVAAVGIVALMAMKR